jgi:ribosome modulation factor
MAKKPAVQADNDAPAAGHNSKELTANERAALRMHHIRQLLQVEKDMQPLRDLRKKIRAEAKGDGFKLTEIDAGMRLATMEDPTIFVAEIHELIAIAQAFNALPPGEQGDLFPDRRPKDEQAFEEGRQAGLAGKNCDPLHGAETDLGQRWIAGWHEGQRIMREDLETAMTKRNAAASDELIKGSASEDEPFPEAAE